MNLWQPPVRGTPRASFSLLDRELPIAVLVPVALFLVAVFAYTASQLGRVVSSSSVFIASYAILALVGLLLFARRARTAVDNGLAKESGRLNRWYAVGVILSLTAALWALWFSDVSLSPWFALFLSIALALLAVQTIASSGRRHSVVILAQILLVGAVLRIAPYYLNPYVYASDTYFHYTIVQATITTGHLVGLGPYAYYPGYHVFNAVALLVTGLPPMAFAFIDLAAIILSVLLVYVIGKRLLSERVGLLAALFLVFGNFYFPSASYQPTFLGIITMMTAFFAIVLRNDGAKPGTWIVFWLAAVTTLFIHPVNFVVLVVVLAGAYVALLLRRAAPRASSIPVWSSTILFIAYIMYISFFLFSAIVTGILETGGTGLTPTSSRTASVVSVFTGELVYAYLGIAGKAILLVPGLLFLLAKRDPKQTWPGLAVGFVLLIPFVGFLGGILSSLQLTRFLLYSDVLIVFPVAYGLLRLVKGAPEKRQQIMAGALTFALALVSLTSYVTVDTGGFMTTAIPVQPGFIDEAGFAAHSFLVWIPAGESVAMDSGSVQYLAASPSRGPLQLPGITLTLFDPAVNMTGYVAVDVLTARSGTYTGSGLQKVSFPSWVEQSNVSPGWNRIYDSGTFLVYLSA